MNSYHQSEAERVLGLYGDMVYRIIRVRLSGRYNADVDDAFQNVFVAYMQKPPNVEASSDVERAWFIRCAVNRANDVFRAVKRRGEVTLNESSRVSEDIGENYAMDALFKLPDALRMPMYLCYVMGYSTSECAKLLGIGTAALRMRLTRARRLFGEIYNAQI